MSLSMAPRLKFPRLIIAFVMELYLYSCTDTYSGILGAIKNVVYTACTGMELGMVFGGMMAHSRHWSSNSQRVPVMLYWWRLLY